MTYKLNNKGSTETCIRVIYNYINKRAGHRLRNCKIQLLNIHLCSRKFFFKILFIDATLASDFQEYTQYAICIDITIYILHYVWEILKKHLIAVYTLIFVSIYQILLSFSEKNVSMFCTKSNLHDLLFYEFFFFLWGLVSWF